MKRSGLISLLILFFAASLLSACGEPTRDQYRDMAAEELCAEADRCGNLGERTYNDCLVEERARFSDLWPSSECSDGRINADRYERCINRVKVAACDGNFFDGLSAWSECRASQVCID